MEAKRLRFLDISKGIGIARRWSPRLLFGQARENIALVHGTQPRRFSFVSSAR